MKTHLIRFFVYGGWFTWAAVVSGAVTVGGALLNKQKAPAAAPYVPIDPSKVTSDSLNADLANQGKAQQLSATTNSFNQGQATQLMNQALPGYSDFSGNLTKTASNLAANPYEVPQSVVDQLTQYAGENNINEGTGAASGFSKSNLLRSLGVNALQYGQSNIQTAMSALGVLTGTAPRISPTSPLSFMLQPSQVLAAQTNNNTQQQAVQQGANNANAAAGNANSSNLWDSLTSGQGSIAGLLKLLTASNGGGGGSAAAYDAATAADAAATAGLPATG